MVGDITAGGDAGAPRNANLSFAEHNQINNVRRCETSDGRRGAVGIKPALRDELAGPQFVAAAIRPRIFSRATSVLTAASSFS
jgi:hypothetical protein